MFIATDQSCVSACFIAATLCGHSRRRVGTMSTNRRARKRGLRRARRSGRCRRLQTRAIVRHRRASAFASTARSLRARGPAWRESRGCSPSSWPRVCDQRFRRPPPLAPASVVTQRRHRHRARNPSLGTGSLDLSRLYGRALADPLAAALRRASGRWAAERAGQLRFVAPPTSVVGSDAWWLRQRALWVRCCRETGPSSDLPQVRPPFEPSSTATKCVADPDRRELLCCRFRRSAPSNVLCARWYRQDGI